jgi:hypothetical protein
VTRGGAGSCPSSVFLEPFSSPVSFPGWSPFVPEQLWYVSFTVSFARLDTRVRGWQAWKSSSSFASSTEDEAEMADRRAVRSKRATRGEGPRRMKPILLGRPRGVKTSRGTVAAYPRVSRACQRALAGMADLPPQGVRAEIPRAAVEPAVLPGTCMSAGSAPLAGGQAATPAASHGRGPSAARSGRAHPAAESGGPFPTRAARRHVGTEAPAIARVVTQRLTSSR